MSKLLKYFFHVKTADKLPPIPRMYSTDEERPLTDKEATLMRMSAIRSPRNIERLKRRYRVSSEDDLIAMLPTRPRKRRPERLMPLIRRMLGLYRYNPARRYYYEHRRRQR